MRTIKFRAWDKAKKKMVYSSDELYGFEIYLDGSFSVSEDDGIKGLMHWVYRKPADFELMQFTGLLDKNGKEIYEGDVVKGWEGDDMHDFDACIVKYEEDGFGIYDEKQKWPYVASLIEIVNNRSLEIIGNIYENPSLLEAK